MSDPVTLLVREIGQELDHLRELLQEAAAIDPPWGTVEKRAIASILHDFYTCCERVFRRIALELDSFVPGESDWHRSLLRAMTHPVHSVRPAVVSKDLAGRLDEYLGFRHVFRNIYGFELEGERLTRLARELPATAARFEAELRDFQNWLKS